MEKKMWFRRKRYGYGWEPATKEGWFATLGFVGVTLLVTYFFKQELARGNATTFIFSLMLLLWIFFMFIKSHAPKAKWQWGEK